MITSPPITAKQPVLAMEDTENENFAIFRDCLSTTLLERSKIKSEPKR